MSSTHDILIGEIRTRDVSLLSSIFNPDIITYSRVEELDELLLSHEMYQATVRLCLQFEVSAIAHLFFQYSKRYFINSVYS